MTSTSSPLTRRRRRLPTALLAGAALVAAVPGTAAADGLALVDRTESIGPGITLQHLKTVDVTGWYDSQILRVDLSNGAVTSDLLMFGDKVAQSGPLSRAADRVGAVAGVNADFFDIDASQAPLGGAVRGGQLVKSPNARGWQHVGVGRDGLGRLVDLAVEATATLDGTAHAVASVNAANTTGTDANALVAYTSAWGSFSRARGVQGGANVAEVLVQDGRVVSVNATGAGDGEIPEGAFYLVGREAAGDAIRALNVGDPVELAYGLRDEVARDLQFGVGHNAVLIENGEPVAHGGTDVAPRTSIGFADGGSTMILATTDGRQSPVNGMTLRQMSELMDEAGAETAVNLDGGGSTTMFARYAGDDRVTIRNSPSDGYERSDPNGVGVFVANGSGRVEDLLVTPSDESARVFPGLHRTLRVKAVDDHRKPVALARGDVRWTSTGGSVQSGVLHAPEDVFGSIRVRATTDTAQVDTAVRVLGELTSLEIDRTRLAIAEPGAGNAVTVTVTGRDGEGFRAPVGAADLELDYDDSVIDVQPVGDKLRIVPKTIGGTLLTLSVAGEEVKLPISVGVETQVEYDFSDGGAASGRWITNGTGGRARTLTDTAEGLQLTYEAARNMGFGARVAWDNAVPLAGQPLAVRIRVKSQERVTLTYAVFRDPDNRAVTVYGPPLRGGNEWETVEFTPPPSTRFPVRFSYFQAIETNAALQRDGVLTFGGIETDNPSEVEIPAPAPLKSDPLVSADGDLGEDDFTFATLSDVQFTAVNPEMAPVAVAALKRIRATDADLVVLNGDIVDLGERADMDLARTTLEAGGCEMVELGTTTVPEKTDTTIPCLYVPGNHESYRPGAQGTLDAFRAEFGRAYGVTDHKGTRFITLNSAYGSLRGSDYDQLPMLQQALTEAAGDEAIDNVMVFAHHPTLDPRDTRDSQLGDRLEVQLIERLLSGFRDESGKGVAMVGSHAQIMNVRRHEGVPYVVLPSSGKSPYGTPDRGGITGWVRWGVDSDESAAGEWLELDVHPFAQEIDLQVPASLEVGNSAPLGGHLVQPLGIQPGSRQVPLDYPLTLRWSGSDQLAIGTGGDAVEAAREAEKVAILDPVTGELTALRTGQVAVTVEADSMREGDDLAPIVTTRTIDVVASTGPGPKAWITGPTFPAQAATTIGEGQAIAIANTGDEPLQVGLARIDAIEGPKGDFIVSDDACSAAPIPAGESCTVLVRFAPARENATSTAKFVFAANTAQQRHTVTISATSTGLPRGDRGDQGVPGVPGEDGPVGPEGPQGPAGPEGPAGSDGQPGPQGPAGNDGPQGPAGNDGPAGPAGPQGDAGNPGPTGPQGATGAKGDRGARGAKGDPGRDALVTCTVRRGLYQSVTCVVTYRNARASVNGRVKATTKATLVRNKRVYAKGSVRSLRATRKVTRGKYTLRAGKGKKAQTFAVTLGKARP